MEKITLGTIGSGKIVHDILDAVVRVDGISVEAVYSRTEEKGRALAADYGVEKVYTDLCAFFDAPEFNTVYIASPNSLHFSQAKAALEHGKHVICEKPMCPTKAEVDELIALAKEKHLFLVDATPTAFVPNFELVKKLLPEVGRLRLVLTNYSQYSSRYDDLLAGKVANVFNPEFAGGSLMDINYYNAYFCAALFGKPLKTAYYPNLCSTGADTSGSLILVYPEFVCQNAGAKDTWGVNSAQIEGEKGFLYVAGGSNAFESVRIVTKERDETLTLQGNEDRRYYEIENMVRYLLSDDFDAIFERLFVTSTVIGIIEEALRNT